MNQNYITQSVFQLHIKEIKYRIFYLILSFISCFSISFLFKSEFLIYFITDPQIYQSLLKYASQLSDLQYPLRESKDPSGFFELFESLNGEAHIFIFTHITEAFISYIKFSLFLSLIFIIPYFFYLLLLFLKPGLFYYEYKKISSIILQTFIMIYPFFFLIYSWFFWPTILNWAQSFSINTHYAHKRDHWVSTLQGEVHSPVDTLPQSASWLNFQPKFNEFISFYINFTLIFLLFIFLLFFIKIIHTYLFLQLTSHPHEPGPPSLNRAYAHSGAYWQPLRRFTHIHWLQKTTMRPSGFGNLTIKRFRFLIWFILLIISAIITPPDLITLIFMFCPLLIIFEFSIWFFSYFFKKASLLRSLWSPPGAKRA